MTNRAQLILDVIANAASLADVTRGLTAVGTGAQSAAQQATSALDRIREHAAGVASGQALQQLGAKLFSASAAMVAGAFQAGQGLESMETRLKGALGSEQAASAELQKLQTIATNSAFTLPGLVQGELRLVNTGKAAAAARSEMLDIGEATARVGGGAEVLNGVSTALEQMATKTRVQTQELLQLSERGIPAFQILAQYIGQTTARTQELVTAGEISSDVFERAFHEFYRGPQAGASAMQAAAQTMTGLISTASDLKDQLGGNFMEAAFKEAEPVIAVVLGELQDPRTVANIREMGKAAGEFAAEAIKAAENAGKWLGIIAPPAAGDAALAAAQARIDAIKEQQQASTQSTQVQVDGQKQVAAQIRQVNRDLEDVRGRYDKLLDPLREKLRLENASYQAQVRERELERARGKLSDDSSLAGDLFSDAGRAARDAIKGDRERVADLEVQQAHQGRVDSIEGEIRATEKRRDAALDALNKEKRALDLQQEGYRTSNGLLATQATGIAGLTQHILDQVTAVQNLAGAWAEVAKAQSLNEAEATDKSNMGQLAGQMPAIPSVSHALQGILGSLSGNIGAMLKGKTDEDPIANAQLQAAYDELGQAAQNAVLGAVPAFPFPKGAAGPQLGRGAIATGSKGLYGLYNPAVTAAMNLPNANSPMQVKIFIGDQELKGLIKTEITQNGKTISQAGGEYQRGRQRVGGPQW